MSGLLPSSRLPLLAFGRSGRVGSRQGQKANGKPLAYAERYRSPEGHLAAGEETFASLGHSYYIYGLPGESIAAKRTAWLAPEEMAVSPRSPEGLTTASSLRSSS